MQRVFTGPDSLHLLSHFLLPHCAAEGRTMGNGMVAYGKSYGPQTRFSNAPKMKKYVFVFSIVCVYSTYC